MSKKERPSCIGCRPTRTETVGFRQEDLQAILGHESYEITASIYIHQSPGTLQKAMEIIG
ncbi:MAG: hypothetical protein LUG55_02690 [Clostridiales bacterium]|nr:hypothetical protein [Clostridiales bacterium]